MRWFRSFFSLSRSQTNGLVVLLPLLLLVLFSEPLYRRLVVPDPLPPVVIMPDSAFDNQNHVPTAPMGKSGLGNTFDPNTVDYEDWLALGLPERIAGRIVAYRKKGGRFVYREDLLKIYGMDSTLYNRLLPYVDLPAQPLPQKLRAANQVYISKLHDLNHADTMQLLRVYGIGPVLAGRILRYRQALGGFLSWQQLYGVYGLDSAVIQRMQQKFFIDTAFVPRKININKATFQELAAHPLISNRLARAVVTYRHQHGSFTSPDDIRKIIILTEEEFQRIKPYLSVE